MANWYGASRSNYFKVKDTEEFENFLDQFGGIEYHSEEDESYCIIAEEGCWPSSIYNEETDEYEDYDDFFQDLSSHLLDDQVCIIVTSGHEKMRYITGDAYAINSKGQELSININSIYDMVRKAWNVEPSLAEY